MHRDARNDIYTPPIHQESDKAKADNPGENQKLTEPTTFTQGQQNELLEQGTGQPSSIVFDSICKKINLKIQTHIIYP